MNTPGGPRFRHGSVLRVAQAAADLPPVGTLGTVVHIFLDSALGVQWGPDQKSTVPFAVLFRGLVTVFQY